MARRATTTLPASVAYDDEVDYRTIANLRGGVNRYLPPTDIEDNESPDLLNLVFNEQILSVDFGFRTFGSPVLGQPQKPITWWGPTSNLQYTVLVTSQTLYTWDAALMDWTPVAVALGTEVLTQVVGAGAPSTSVTLVAPPTFNVGDRVFTYLDNDVPVVGIVNTIVGAVVNFQAVVPVGRTIEPGQLLSNTPNFNGFGRLPISYVTDPIRGWLIFTNGYDPVQYYDGEFCKPLPGLDAVADPGAVTTARYLTRFHGVLVLGWTVEGGISFPTRIRRSATGDSTNWTTLNAGFDDLIDNSDEIRGFVDVNPYFGILRRNSIIRASYYGVGQQVFWYDTALSGTGSLGSRLYLSNKVAGDFFSEQGVYRCTGSFGLTDLGQKVFSYVLSYTGDFNSAEEDTAFGLYNAVLDQDLFFYAAPNHTYPNKLLIRDEKTGVWFPRQFTKEFAGAGFYYSGTTLRWMDLTITWLEDTTTWTSRAGGQNFPFLLLCGADDNQVYVYDYRTRTEDGADIAWHWTSKDFPQLADFVTLDGVVLYGRGDGILVEASLDGGQSWRTLGTVNLGTTIQQGGVDCSLTSLFIRLRFSGTDPTFRLNWFSMRYLKAGPTR